MNNSSREEIKEALFNAFYWYYRKRYGEVTDLIVGGNKLTKIKTQYSDYYIECMIKKLIRKVVNAT